MDNEQARFLLSAAHPSGRDADRPEIAEALAHAQRDPELAAWLSRERASDLAISRKLRELEPDASLRARVLAGAMASRRRARSHRLWRTSLAWAAAAMIVLAGGSWLTDRLLTERSSASAPATPALLADWQRDAVSIFNSPFFALDFRSASYPPVQEFLRARGAIVAGDLPFTDRVVSAVGCKVLDWRGTTFSLACFLSDTGELVHLFVRPREGLDTALLSGTVLHAQIGDFATTTWLQGDRVIMVASKLPAPELDRMLQAAALASATPPRPAPTG